MILGKFTADLHRIEREKDPRYGKYYIMVYQLDDLDRPVGAGWGPHGPFDSEDDAKTGLRFLMKRLKDETLNDIKELEPTFNRDIRMTFHPEDTDGFH